MLTATSWLWDPLPQFWGNKQKLQDLEQYLSDLAYEPTDEYALWASMAERTPSSVDVVSGFLTDDSLAKWATSVNKHLTSWYKYRFPYEPNIIATDYFLGNSIVDVAIYKNIQKGLDKKFCCKLF